MTGRPSINPNHEHAARRPRRSTVRRRLLVLGGVVALSLLGATERADADVPVRQVGWWTRSLAPPTVPEGGLSVGAAPDGDLSVGAVMLDVGGGASSTSLRLVETDGQGQQLATLQVCPAETSWTPADGGALADAPMGQCETSSVPMERGDEGTWTADIQELIKSKTGTAAVLVKPGADAISSFQIAFAPPIVHGSASPEQSPNTEKSAISKDGASSPPSAEPTASNRPAAAPPAVASEAPTGPPAHTTENAAREPVAPAGDPAAAASSTEFQPSLRPPLQPVTGRNVGRVTVFWWFITALFIGAVVAAISWASAEVHLFPAHLFAGSDPLRSSRGDSAAPSGPRGALRTARESTVRAMRNVTSKRRRVRGE